MKTSVKQLAAQILFLAVFSLTGISYANSGNSPFSLVKTADSEMLVISEKYSDAFLRDPVAFINENFDPTVLPIYREKNKYDSYEVLFSCSKGVAKARFNENWKLEKTNIQLENVVLPVEIRHSILQDYPGWDIVKNKKVITVSKGKTKTEYKLLLKQGKNKKRVRVA